MGYTVRDLCPSATWYLQPTTLGNHVGGGIVQFWQKVEEKGEREWEVKLWQKRKISQTPVQPRIEPGSLSKREWGFPLPFPFNLTLKIILLCICLTK